MLVIGPEVRFAHGGGFHVGWRARRSDRVNAMQAHRHRALVEIVVGMSGTFSHTVNGCSHRDGSGSCTLLRARDCHALEGRDCAWMNIAVASEHWTAADEFLGHRLRALHDGLEAPRRQLAPPELQSLLAEVRPFIKADPRDPSLARRLLLVALAPFLSAPSSTLPAEDAAPPWLRSALRLLEALPAHQLSTVRVAATCARSPEHVARSFRRHLGLTPSTWCNQRRLDEAARRLRDGDEDVTGIALDVGFASINYFYALFRRRFRCSPSDLRRRRHGGW